ncbi:MAG: ATP-binding protein [Candidatus Sumerlaeia bacterium]|nr:ATP-binding protein [Candidatus Sumerlaeia bacterium]
MDAMEKTDAEKLIRLARHVSEVLASPADLDHALEATVNLLRNVLEAEACSIMLLDAPAGVLRMAASSDIEREKWPTISTRLDEGFAGKVARSGRPLLVREIGDDSHLDAERRRRYTCPSFMCVPMKSKGQVIGVINVTNRIGSEPFSREQLDMVTSLANLIALAIENARLLATAEAMGRRLRDVLEGIGDGVIAVDTNGVILLHNELALHYLGVESGRCLGRRIEEVVPETVLPVFRTLYERTLAERSHIHEEVEWTPLDQTGATPLTLSTAPLYREARGNLSGVVFVIHDMTLHHKLDELKRIDEAKNSFLAIVSHELRTPLTAIKGASHLLRTKLAQRLDPDNLELLKIVEQNAERLMQQIVNLLDVVNIENRTASLTLRRLPLSQIARRSVARLRDTAAAKNLSIVEDYSAGDAELLLDEEKIARALDHLVGNAVKFTPRGGQVTVCTGSSRQEAYVAVRDTGAGIDPALRDQIFRKFVQGESHLTRQSGGCGIGLYVARAFAELHGGRIETTNLEGGGCEFRLVLPIMHLHENAKQPDAFIVDIPKAVSTS